MRSLVVAVIASLLLGMNSAPDEKVKLPVKVGYALSYLMFENITRETMFTHSKPDLLYGDGAVQVAYRISTEVREVSDTQIKVSVSVVQLFLLHYVNQKIEEKPLFGDAKCFAILDPQGYFQKVEVEANPSKSYTIMLEVTQHIKPLFLDKEEKMEEKEIQHMGYLCKVIKGDGYTKYYSTQTGRVARYACEKEQTTVKDEHTTESVKKKIDIQIFESNRTVYDRQFIKDFMPEKWKEIEEKEKKREEIEKKKQQGK